MSGGQKISALLRYLSLGYVVLQDANDCMVLGERTF